MEQQLPGYHTFKHALLSTQTNKKWSRRKELKHRTDMSVEPGSAWAKVQTSKKMQNRKLERLKHLHVLFPSLDYNMYAVITATIARRKLFYLKLSQWIAAGNFCLEWTESKVTESIFLILKKKIQKAPKHTPMYYIYHLHWEKTEIPIVT